MATRSHGSRNDDRGNVSSPIDESVEQDSWDELAKQVRVRAVLHRHDPARFSRIKIGRFDAQLDIGRGGFGMVFKALDPDLNRWVALKVCLTRSLGATEGLMEEARKLAELDHPNIVTVYEPGEHEGTKFFVMPYNDGQNAAEFAKREPRPTWRQIVEVYRGVAKGLAAAHRKGVAHGDVKPQNILFDLYDFPRIADFGLARRVIEDADESEQEVLRRRAGTLYYMAPEVLLGERGDALSDQFSFFVSIAQTLNGGVLPFEGESSGEMLDAIKCTVVQFEDPTIPQALIALVRIGLSVEPHERFPDMDVVQAELERLLQSEPDEAVLEPPVPEVEPEQQEPSKARRGAFAIALLLAGAAVGWMGRPSVEVRETTEPDPLSPTSPCALGEGAGTSVAIDPVVLDVCEQIRNCELDEADDAWAREYLERRPTAPADELAEATRIVARTFFDQAEVLTRSEQVQHGGRTLTATEQQALARTAAGFAALWLEQSRHLAAE